MGIALSNIEEHWGYIGGLWEILKENPKMKGCIYPHFSKKFKNRVESHGGQLIEVDKFTQICKNIYTTGEIEGRWNGKCMSEQALALKTSKGVSVLTGCAHPSIIRIIENAKQNIASNVYLVMGGFHLRGKHKKTINCIVDTFKKLGIERVAPGHCTGKNAIKVFKKI